MVRRHRLCQILCLHQTNFVHFFFKCTCHYIFTSNPIIHLNSFKCDICRFLTKRDLIVEYTRKKSEFSTSHIYLKIKITFLSFIYCQILLNNSPIQQTQNNRATSRFLTKDFFFSAKKISLMRIRYMDNRHKY